MTNTFGFIMKSWEFGVSKVVGRFQSVISLVLLVSTFLAVRGIDLSLPQMIIFGAVVVSIVFFSGMMYFKTGLFRREYHSLFKEQPEMVEMKQETEKILAKVNAIEKLLKTKEIK